MLMKWCWVHVVVGADILKCPNVVASDLRLLIVVWPNADNILKLNNKKQMRGESLQGMQAQDEVGQWITLQPW